MKLAKGRPYHGAAEENSVALYPEDPEDMWHAYNLIVPGDIVQAHAIRKITLNGLNSVEGAGATERVHTELTIRVKATSFDPLVSTLRVSGTVCEENPYVSLGQHHTLEVEVNRSFVVVKPDGWDSVAKGTLKEALSDDKNGALAAVVMQEGLANICLVTQFRTVLKTRVESVVPKKRDTAALQNSGMSRYFDKVLASLTRAVDFSESRPLLLASPGFVATDFKEYITNQGRDKKDKVLAAVAKQVTIIHAPSGHVHSLNEVLQSPEVVATLKDMKYSKEARYVDDFFKMLKLDDGRAWYGAASVEKAVDDGAVGAGAGLLLINNSLFRSKHLATRKKYIALVDKVRADGGNVRVLSSDHGSGERLKMIGDIAAILNYPMLDLDENEETPPASDAEDRQDREDDFMLDSVI